jgi:hypothetical protein
MPSISFLIYFPTLDTYVLFGHHSPCLMRVPSTLGLGFHDRCACSVPLMFYAVSDLKVQYIWRLITHLIHMFITSGVLFQVWYAHPVLLAYLSNMHAHLFWHLSPRPMYVLSCSDILSPIRFACAMPVVSFHIQYASLICLMLIHLWHAWPALLWFYSLSNMNGSYLWRFILHLLHMPSSSWCARLIHMHAQYPWSKIPGPVRMPSTCKFSYTSDLQVYYLQYCIPCLKRIPSTSEIPLYYTCQVRPTFCSTSNMHA